MSSNKRDINLGLGSYMFVQTALLVFRWHIPNSLPVWVVWFPTLIFIIGLILAIILLIIIVIIEAKID